MKSLFIVAILIFDASCLSTAHAADARLGTPTVLTADEAAVLLQEVRQELKKPASAVISAIRGMRSTVGVLTACGYVSVDASSSLDKMPFFGVVGNNTNGKPAIAMVAIGNNDRRSADILAWCRRKGMALP